MSRLLLVVLGGLALAAAPTEALTVRDMLGREVRLAGPPTRMVSLVPSVTEIVFALGGEDRLVGVTDYCDFPPAATLKPRVGGMVAPSLEAIVALKPNLVIATTQGTREDTVVQLERLGIPVYLVGADRVAEMFDVVARLGDLTGRSAAVTPLVMRLERRIDAVRRAVGPFRRPRVLYVLWPDPLIVPGRNAFVTELIELAGGTSVTTSAGNGYPRVSLEAVVAEAPEVIVLARHDRTTRPPSPAGWLGLASVPAVRAGRIHTVDGDLLHRYGPRVVDGLEQLARAIHPEAFR